MSLEQELANVEPDRIEVLDVSKSFTTKRGTLRTTGRAAFSSLATLPISTRRWVARA